MIRFQKINETYGKIQTLDNDALWEIKDYCQFQPEGYRFNKKYKYGAWSGKIQLVGQNGEFPLGLLKIIVKFCVESKYKIEISDTLKTHKAFESKEEFDKWVDSKEIWAKGERINPYWYQRESVFQALQKNRGIINAPTSAGKSLMIALLAKWFSENFDQKILVIVPTTSLTAQMKNDLIDYRLFKESDIAEIRAGTSHFVYDKTVVVQTWQSAHKKDPEWFEQFGMLIVDETHLQTGASIQQMVKLMTNCVYKIGLSGQLKDGKANILNYIGLFGDIIKLVQTNQLMEEGQVAKLKIKALKIDYPESDKKEHKKDTYDEEIKFIIKNEKRCKLLAKLAIGCSSKNNNENTLLMFRYQEHGKMMYEEICKSYPKEKVFFINGEIKTKDRVKIQELADKVSGIIIVAQYATTGTGISIKNLQNVIFGQPIKSKVTVLQTIGRSLRLHKDKEFATVYDIIDDLSIRSVKTGKITHQNYALKHGLDRIKRYNEEKFEYQINSYQLK